MQTLWINFTPIVLQLAHTRATPTVIMPTIGDTVKVTHIKSNLVGVFFPLRDRFPTNRVCLLNFNLSRWKSRDVGQTCISPCKMDYRQGDRDQHGKNCQSASYQAGAGSLPAQGKLVVVCIHH